MNQSDNKKSFSFIQTIEIDKGRYYNTSETHEKAKWYWDYKAIFKFDELVGLYLTFVML